ncbi:TPA: hypothetical protein ACIZMV_002178 [Streptococcus agalactiae]|uniref:hypothetical protein n=1 Tax=Streptococcus agalactiae TaxID=1311 RepID=UPI0005E33FD1|nr:hypothetical protein [Streptococcus agalactiae]KAF1204903.1 hypothetical protein B8V46_07550 [Streptococcus agalactiae]MCW1398584.1 hypothetical protein [Streptococcus agalactiae]MCW1638305.1 hypothetical protein [Streptococcus agalactiae]MDX5012536.1 hypothetical protein [Streptococcus agalactiae]CNE23342.1 Uncharacterised protein [Streptococcus agalactiae]
MAWFEYLTDSLKKFCLKKSITDFENETENEEEGYDPRFNDSNSEERGIKIKTYYENWVNQTFDSLLEKDGCVELELLINDNAISESFSFRNIGINYSATKTADFNFRYRSISVLPKYRERGVCSYLLLKSIIVVLEALENKDVEFSLVNTVKIEIGDKFSIYDSILTEKIPNENMQYRVFLSENRDTDLAQLREMYNSKLEKITTNLKFA